MPQCSASNSPASTHSRVPLSSRNSSRYAVRSACSSASSSIKKAGKTIKALKKETLDEKDETLSISSSQWDTDLEDDDFGTKKERTDKETYENICQKLGVTPVSRFSREIGQEEIKISHRHLREMGAKAIAAALVKNNTVLKVQVPSNDLSPKGGVYIGRVLKSNKTLNELNLADNNINNEGIRAISEALSDNNVIRRLDLSGNGLTDKDARILSDAIENNSSLRYLNLSYNKFGEAAGQHFGSALSYNNGIVELNLSWNNIRRRGAKAINKSLRYNDTLEKLDLSWNGFDDFGTDELKEALLRNTSLVEFNISNNRLSDVGITNIALGLEGNDNLEVLDLSRNAGITCSKGVVVILQYIKKKKCNLKTLRIIDVNLDGACVHLITDCLEANEELDIVFGCKKKDTFSSKKAEINPFDLMKEYIIREKIHMSDLFRRLDIDGQFRDCLTREEFIDGMKRLKVMNKFYIDQLVELLDSDGDGEIDYSEFVKLNWFRAEAI